MVVKCAGNRNKTTRFVMILHTFVNKSLFDCSIYFSIDTGTTAQTHEKTASLTNICIENCRDFLFRLLRVVVLWQQTNKKETSINKYVYLCIVSQC